MEVDENVVCFLCGKGENVKKFTDSTLEKCKTSLEIRKAANIQYHDVVVPDTCDASVGYHPRPCYSNFNSIKSKYKQAVQSSEIDNDAMDVDDAFSWELNESSSKDDNEENYNTYSEVESSNVSSKSDNPIDKVQSCIICGKRYKRVNYRHLALSSTTNYDSFEQIKKYATKWNDVVLLNNIDLCETRECPIMYHGHCKASYNVHSKTKLKEKSAAWHVTRNHYKIAFNKLCIFVENFIIKQEQYCYMKFITDLFRDFLHQSYNDETLNKHIFHTKRIPAKLMKHFRNKIKILSKPNVPKILYPGHSKCAINMEVLSNNDVIMRAALILRDEIRKIPVNKIEDDVTLTALLKGECAIPLQLSYFYTTLLSGFNYRRRKTERTKRLAESFAYDIIYAVTNGSVNTSKHITLASSIKSLCNSKKILRILFKYGHICSYDVIEGLETEATYHIVEKEQLAASDMVLQEGLHTSIAFDNFDRFIETSRGQTTVNDTVGIAIQDISESSAPQESIEQSQHHTVTSDTLNIDSNSNSREDSRSCDSNISTQKRRRTFEGILLDIPQYFKKPKVTEVLQPYNVHEMSTAPPDFLKARKFDILWMLSHYMKIPTPMWTGFNSKIIKDNTVKQRVSYLTPINKSPTDRSVVIETMRRALTIAGECKENYAQLTYDLGIAQIAMALKSAEKEEFKKLFIHLGGFHTEMAFMKAIGTFIKGCGLTTILIEAELLGAGSEESFTSGKIFNRCKRLHILAALSLELLEFDFFVEQKNINITDNVTAFIKNLKEDQFDDLTIDNTDVNDLITQFLDFHSEVLLGYYGKTAQFYALYITLVKYYLLFDRSIRMNNFELYKCMLPKKSNIFFALNHRIYARYMTLYHDMLIMIDETHPGLKEQLVLGVKRTDKAFSRIPVDLTLEQTINAESGRKLTGIAHLSNSIAAKQRWSLNHAIRSAMVSHTLIKLGLTLKQDVSNDLLKNRMEKNMKHIQLFTAAIKNRMNPFSSDIPKEFLFNISTGVAAPTEIADFLLNIEAVGQDKRKEFINNCSLDEKNFSKYVMKKINILNFESAVKKKKVNIAGKVQEVKLQRDLFGRLLGISLREDIDLDKVLTYPLTPVPFSLCHVDGSIVKTDKSILTKLLESSIENHGELLNIDVLLIDGFFLLHTLGQVAQTFGQISRQIANSIVKMFPHCNEIYLLFDTYKTPSIKDNEHILRKNVSKEYSITGASQNRPVDFAAELRNIKFKESLVKFLIEHWCSDEIAEIFGEKEIYISSTSCYKYITQNNKVYRTNVENLNCEGHFEADTKFSFFLSKLQNKHNAVIRCADTDILIIILGNIEQYNEAMNIWLQYGVGNNCRLINTSAIYATLGNQVCLALPAFHCFTGSDFTPAFYRRGKKKPLSMLLSNEEYQKAFADLAQHCDAKKNASVIEKFVCEMYSTKTNKLRNVKLVNDARLRLFIQQYGMVDNMEVFKKKIISFDASNIPPCSRELEQQILRAAYVGNMWRNAYKNIPSTLDPADYGWTLTDGELTFKWFEGPETPENINEIVLSGENEQESSTDPGSGSQEPENFNDEIDRNDYLNQGDEDDDDDDNDDDDDEAESDDCADLDYNETYEDSSDD